jgi:hypothetical protein
MKPWTGLVLLLSVSLAGCPRDWPEPFLRLRQESSCLLGRDVARDGPEDECSPACLAYRGLSPEERAQVDAWLGGAAICPLDPPRPTGFLPPWRTPGATITPLPRAIVPPLETVHHGILWHTIVYQRRA